MRSGYAHEQGVLHRDIKPANLLIDEHRRRGLGRRTSAWPRCDRSRRAEPRRATSIGTLRYLAPESGSAAFPTTRSDVYSLGLTLYELAALRPAHESPDRAELIRKIAEGRPPRLRDRAPALPLALESVILKAIEPEPARRYASAGAMAGDLSRFLAGRPVLARKAAPPERLARWVGRNRAVAALAGTSIALALLAAVFIALFLLAPPRPSPPPRHPGDFDGPPPRRWFPFGPRPGPPPLPPPPRE